tara:strand:+ start:3562 stop:4779 length:1218 start_codon:yes stop_codon:yes gene_type:complete
MNNNYDIIIVGGGPAGSSAALYAKKAGLKAIILDKNTFPRDKICGDALSGKSVKYMRELGVLNEVPKLKGATINRITFASPSHKSFDINLSGTKKENIKEGYVVPRETFDNFLFEKAKKVSDVKENFKVTNLITEGNQVIGIKGISNKKTEKIYAPIILGCDGSKSVIARKLGYHTEDEKNTAIAIRCYYSGVEGLTDQIELHFVDEVLPGYFWMFPAGKNIANIGIGLSKKNAKKDERKLTQILDEVTKSDFFINRFKNAKKLEKPKGWSLPLGRIKRPNHGNGFMLLGDAAGLIDPFTGEGIGNAMGSAKIAVEISSLAHQKRDFSKKMFSEYDKLVWKEFGPELKTSTKLQNLANYRTLLNLVINKASLNKNIQEIISGMLTKEIPKEKLSNPMFYLKLFFS